MPGSSALNVFNQISIVHMIGKKHKHRKFSTTTNQKWFSSVISGHHLGKNSLSKVPLNVSK